LQSTSHSNSDSESNLDTDKDKYSESDIEDILHIDEELKYEEYEEEFD
jgi:hypothetical protein